MKKGFTLAEVLITLGIIGVVSAMTIPTLVTNIRGARFRSQFKKSISTLNQAVRLNKANYDWDFSNLHPATENEQYCAALGVSGNPETNRTMCAILNGSLKGASPIPLANENYYPCTDENCGNYFIKLFSDSALSNAIIRDLDAYTLADGSVFAYISGPAACFLPIGKKPEDVLGIDPPETNNNAWLYPCVGFIDVNGPSLPNKEVKCSEGETKLEPSTPCTVKNKDMGDVFPVVFYDATITPLTNASAYVLNTTK